MSQVPKSCCKANTDGNMFDCEDNPTDANSFSSGCYRKATDAVERYGLIIGGVGIVIALLMVSHCKASIIRNTQVLRNIKGKNFT